MKGQISVLLIVAGVVIALSGLWVYSAGKIITLGDQNLTINNTLCFTDGTCMSSAANITFNQTVNITYNISNVISNSSVQCIGGMALYNTSLTNGNLTGECITIPEATTTLPYSNISGTPTIPFQDGVTIPANNVTSGNFTGIYSFDQNTSNTTFLGDVQVIGKIYGGSPVKIAGGLNVTTGIATFSDIYVTSCTGCTIYNASANFSAVNVTNGTFVNLIVTGNLTFPNNSILNEYINSLDAGKLYNLSALNYQIILDASNITNLKVYNESGIRRNYTVTGNLTATLPDSDIIIMKGVITTTNPESILLTFNNDNSASYLYRRIQGLVWLYQAVTVNPQKNITLEQYQSTAQRDVTITIFRTGTDISGEFMITAYTNSTLAPYKTTGSFNYKNTTEVNTFSILTSTTNNSYLIVTSESK